MKDGLYDVLSQYMGDIVGQGPDQTDAAAIHVCFGIRNPIGLLEYDQCVRAIFGISPSHADISPGSLWSLQERRPHSVSSNTAVVRARYAAGGSTWNTRFVSGLSIRAAATR